MASQNRLTVSNISKTYVTNGTETPVLFNISYTFEQGHSYAITGASGSGKSTLLHLIGGIDDPSAGVLLYNGQMIAQFNPAELEKFRRTAVGFMFQNHYLISELTVLHNIALANRIAGHSTNSALLAAQELLDQVGLTDQANRFPHELSGGQQQRAALARALVNRPQFLLADEPTGNLDSDTAGRITDLIIHAQRSWNLGIIICTHDQRVADRLDIKLHIEQGSLMTVQSCQPL